ncbi:MAG: polymer-forming cytoskeletal protein [Pseudomonadota bacterium]|nr:polymer-forming cytoskeletal protein [Pseudomonadota bacterium]MDE3038282.1 polymer-forming cytoskeletal protein [Pseudomonadota bacterium]
MFLKNSAPSATVKTPVSKKESSISLITQDMNILGNIIGEGMIDFDGTIDGNIRCGSLTLRANGSIKGEVVANAVSIYGKVRGLIRAKTVHLYASANVEGIIMHEAITIEDGALVDGKFKRTNRVQTEGDAGDFSFDDENAASGDDIKMLENIRLIR